MEHLDYKQYEKLGPFEIKDFLAKVATKAAQEDVAHLSQRRPRQSRTGSPPNRARRSSCSGSSRSPRASACSICRRASAACRKRKALPSGSTPGSTKHADMPGAPFLQRMVPWTVKKFGFDADKFVHELVDSIIGDHYPVPDRMLVHNEQIVHEYLRVGDVRRAASEGQVQDLRGRGRHRRDVLHLQVAEEQSHPEPGRHDRAGRADLHALPGDGAPRGLRPPFRADPREAGAQVPVSGRGAREAARSEDQGVLHRQSRQPVRGGDGPRDHRTRSARCSRSGPT